LKREQILLTLGDVLGLGTKGKAIILSGLLLATGLTHMEAFLLFMHNIHPSSTQKMMTYVPG
jgi:hypothetical protein